MSGLHTILILGVALLLIFLEATFNGVRNLLGAQVDFLPGLVVYTSLSSGPITVTLLALVGGLGFDSLSANPLGISILPLFLIGFLLQYYRGLILREQRFAQWVLGIGGSAVAPVLTLLLLLNAEKQPLIGWFSLWQWIVMAVLGGAATPLWFKFFGWLMRSLCYRELEQISFRPDREIKRGRM